MEERVSIREISLEDTQAIQNRRIAISEEDAQVDFQKLVEQHVSEGKGKTSLVALVNGKVAGYMISTTLYAGFGIGKSAWIVSIGVHPDHMGQGVGAGMFAHAMAAARAAGIRRVKIVSDPNAEAFYEKMGATRWSSP